jgi:hypothetical protein
VAIPTKRDNHTNSVIATNMSFSSMSDCTGQDAGGGNPRVPPNPDPGRRKVTTRALARERNEHPEFSDEPRQEIDRYKGEFVMDYHVSNSTIKKKEV